MYFEIKAFKIPSDFAKDYVKRGSNSGGKAGCGRNNIWYLIKREMAKPGSTEIDVLVCGGVYFVKYKAQHFDPVFNLQEIGRLSASQTKQLP